MIRQIIHNEHYDRWTIDYMSGIRKQSLKTEELPKTAIDFMMMRAPIRVSDVAVKFIK